MNDDYSRYASEILELRLRQMGLRRPDPAREDGYSMFQGEAGPDQNSDGLRRTDRCRVDDVVRSDLGYFETQMSLISVPNDPEKKYGQDHAC